MTPGAVGDERLRHIARIWIGKLEAGASRASYGHPDTPSEYEALRDELLDGARQFRAALSDPPEQQEQQEVRIWRDGGRWMIEAPSSEAPFSTGDDKAAIEETLQGLLDLGNEVEYVPAPELQADSVEQERPDPERVVALIREAEQLLPVVFKGWYDVEFRLRELAEIRRRAEVEVARDYRSGSGARSTDE